MLCVTNFTLRFHTFVSFWTSSRYTSRICIMSVRTACLQAGTDNIKNTINYVVLDNVTEKILEIINPLKTSAAGHVEIKVGHIKTSSRFISNYLDTCNISFTNNISFPDDLKIREDITFLNLVIIWNLDLSQFYPFVLGFWRNQCIIVWWYSVIYSQFSMNFNSVSERHDLQ